MTARIARRLTRSDLIGTLAGLLLAVEGMHLVMSRSGLLDMVLAFWVLAAFGLLLIDRDRTRGRLADLVRQDGLATLSTTWGPRLGLRPWRWAAALALGLACSVKWSGLWFLAFFILMSLVWDVSTRRAIGVQRPWRATILRDAPGAGLSMVAIAVVVYLTSWTGWFVTDGGYARQWAAGQPAVARPRGAAVPVALPRRGVAVPRRTELPAPLRQQRALVVLPGPPDVLLLRERRRRLLQREVRLRRDRPRQSADLVDRDPRRDPPARGAGSGVATGARVRSSSASPPAGCRGCSTSTARSSPSTSWCSCPFVVMAVAMTLGTILGPADAPARRRRDGAVAATVLVLAIVVVGVVVLPGLDRRGHPVRGLAHAHVVRVLGVAHPRVAHSPHGARRAGHGVSRQLPRVARRGWSSETATEDEAAAAAELAEIDADPAAFVAALNDPHARGTPRHAARRQRGAPAARHPPVDVGRRVLRCDQPALAAGHDRPTAPLPGPHRLRRGAVEAAARLRHGRPGADAGPRARRGPAVRRHRHRRRQHRLAGRRARQRRARWRRSSSPPRPPAAIRPCGSG